MCGFAGFLDPSGRVAEPTTTLTAMARTLIHRGPDDEGLCFDQASRVGFAFRRLAIQDLSPAGHQPMSGAGGRFEIVFNGEVYNHHELRDELRALGHTFSGHSDTETMLAACAAWGVERAIARFTGMFAFALLDRHERVLWLVRDRFGVKPLYLAFAHSHLQSLSQSTNECAEDLQHALPQSLANGAMFAFGSELKALRAIPGMRLSVDRDALRLFMRHGYVPSPRTIHPEAWKVRPGHLVRVNLATGRIDEQCWWHSRDLVRRGVQNRFVGSDQDAIDAVDQSLLQSVRLRMLADVPLGAFLSGGIDSTAVVAAMQAQSSRPVRTFTIGFGPRELDEAPYARAIAQHLGTDHTEVYVHGDEALATVPRLADIFDEPFADSSQIPTLLVSAIARKHVTVALSGDGGDELFAGYYRYAWASKLAARATRLPAPARATLVALLRATPRGPANALGALLARVAPRRMPFDRAGDRARKVAEILGDTDPWKIYLRLLANSDDAPNVVLDAKIVPTTLTDPSELASELDLETRMMQADIATYLVDDILVKVDRASMAVSLEAREPLLDHHLAELAFQLPLSMKIRNGERKWILRRVVERRVPRTLFERPKMGFGVPLVDWLRGPLRDWAEDLIHPTRLAREGYLDPRGVRTLWEATLDPSRGSNGYGMWNILMFESWLARWDR